MTRASGVLNLPSDARSPSELALRFRRAKPARHVVIDGFLPPGLCARLEREFPLHDPARYYCLYGKGPKPASSGLTKLGPGFRRFDELVRSPAFVAFLESVSEIKDLVADPGYFGGGSQEFFPGMEFLPHVDVNYHPVLGWHRRLNLILYLNRRWKPGDGGELVFFGDPRRPDGAARRIAPLFNRAVLFAVDGPSWHGVEPVQGPRTRRSVATIYYTRTAPPRPRVTTWRFPALPATLDRLDRRALEAVNKALATRDLEIEFLESGSIGRGWTSPLPGDWTPGRDVSARDARWLRGEIMRRERRVRRLHRAIIARLTSAGRAP